MRQQRHCGFTLVELLVAITIFSVLAAMAYGGLRSVLNTERAIDLSARRLSALQQTMLFVGRDIAQITPRAIRDEFGDTQPALRSQLNTLAAFEFTRGGWSNPAGQMRSSLQRVGYAVEDKQLVRYSWAVLDRAADSQPRRAVLLNDVLALKTRFMDEKREWSETWPLLGADAASAHRLPRAMEFTLELQDLGVVRRLFVIDSATPSVAPAPVAGAAP